VTSTEAIVAELSALETATLRWMRLCLLQFLMSVYPRLRYRSHQCRLCRVANNPETGLNSAVLAPAEGIGVLLAPQKPDQVAATA
jgi:hypothetical protein